MVEPEDVPRVLLDAARLMREGEIVLFGSAALCFWLPQAPRTRDIDLWCEPAERGQAVEALMGELSWYHDRHGAYVEVWGPETFAAPTDWRSRARLFTEEEVPGVRLVVPHPHDILLAKVERWEPADKEHARRILAAFPLDAARLLDLDANMPYRGGRITDPRRVAAYLVHFEELLRMVESAPPAAGEG